METTIKQVSLSQLRQRSNYRQSYDTELVNKVASDMSEHGFKIEFPIVTYSENDSTDSTDEYIVIDGNTRYTAACQASAYGIVSRQASLMVWIVVKPKPTDAQFILSQLAANELRRDPDAVSQAKGYKQAVDSGASVAQIATETGHTEEYVNRRLFLLDLVDEAQKLVANGNLGITYGEAMHELDTNFQRIALQAYNKREVKTIDEYRKLCNELLEKQRTCSLFDLALFNGKPIEMVVDMAKVRTAVDTAKLPDTAALELIRRLEEKLEAEKAQRVKDREYAKGKYGELMAQYRALQAQVSGPLFAGMQ